MHSSFSSEDDSEESDDAEEGDDYCYEIAPNDSDIDKLEALPVSRGAKGRLSTNHTHPRVLKLHDYALEFSLLVKGDDIASAIVAEYKGLMAMTDSSGKPDAASRTMADGILRTAMNVHGATARMMMAVFKVGCPRLDRVRKSSTMTF
jgi:hypothetical protein